MTHHPDHAPSDETGHTWITLGLVHSPGQPPVILEAERRNGPEGRLMRQEVEHARATIQQHSPSPGRSEALLRLRRAQLLIGLQIARGDETGWQTAEALVAYLEHQPGALLWVGGREFYIEGQPLGSWQPPASS